MTASITALYAGILALIVIALAINVTVHRVKLRVPLGDGGNAQMRRMIRLNGNAAEYIPLAVVLMAIFELNGGSHTALHIVGSALERAGKVLVKHHVTVDLSGDLPMLKLDPVLFEQVLFNLLDNAAKYAPVGTEVRLAARRDGDEVDLQLMDEGQGIPPGDLERIFDKFYRVQAVDSRRAGTGTGLGLAICRGFVEAMGGTIVAGNRVDRRGAVFTITFPVPAGQEASQDIAA